MRLIRSHSPIKNHLNFMCKYCKHESKSKINDNNLYHRSNIKSSSHTQDRTVAPYFSSSMRKENYILICVK